MTFIRPTYCLYMEYQIKLGLEKDENKQKEAAFGKFKNVIRKSFGRSIVTVSLEKSLFECRIELSTATFVDGCEGRTNTGLVMDYLMIARIYFQNAISTLSLSLPSFASKCLAISLHSQTIFLCLNVSIGQISFIFNFPFNFLHNPMTNIRLTNISITFTFNFLYNPMTNIQLTNISVTFTFNFLYNPMTNSIDKY